MACLKLSSIPRVYHRGLLQLAKEIGSGDPVKLENYEIVLEDDRLKFSKIDCDFEHRRIPPWPRRVWIVFRDPVGETDPEAICKIANESLNFDLMEIAEIDKIESHFRFKESKYFHEQLVLKRGKMEHKNVSCTLTKFDGYYLYERENFDPLIAQVYDVSYLVQPIWNGKREGEFSQILESHSDKILVRRMKKIWSHHKSKIQALETPLERLISSQERKVLSEILDRGWMNGTIVQTLFEPSMDLLSINMRE